MARGNERLGSGHVQRDLGRHHRKNAGERQAHPRFLGVVERGYDDHHQMGDLVSFFTFFLQELIHFCKFLLVRISISGCRLSESFS